MRKAISALLIISLIASLSGCGSSVKLDLASFEKYALTDLQLEKKDISANDNNAYYDLDHTIDNEAEPTRKRDHTAQVYSTASGSTASSMIMIYTDYQDANEAKSYFEELSLQEESLMSQLKQSSSDEIKIDKGTGYLLVMTCQAELTWKYECLYLQNDVILFVSIIIGTSDINNINKDWLGNAKKFFSDVNIKSPFSLTPAIEKMA